MGKFCCFLVTNETIFDEKTLKFSNVYNSQQCFLGIPGRRFSSYFDRNFRFFLQARSQEEGESSQRRTEEHGEEMNDRRRRRDKNDGEREIEKEEKQNTAKGEVDHESQR